MSNRPPFPAVIDSTMLAAARSCKQKFYQTYVEHWKPKGESVHLVAGAAFARGLEATRLAYYEQGLSCADSVACGAGALISAYGYFEPPEGSSKTLDRMLGALEFYFSAENYPLALDKAKPHVMPSGRHAIEFSFAHPLPILHPQTGDPLLYCGRSDMICDFASGVYIEDDKTTTQLGASWSRQWDLRSQFTGYCWASREAGLPVHGVLVRGVSILKAKYETQQAITYRSTWEIDRWLEQTCRDLDGLIRCWREGYWDFNLDHACTEYGGCAFRDICKSPEPDRWLPMSFERRIWDPLARTETPLAVEEQPA
jgi:hypothetical protein